MAFPYKSADISGFFCDNLYSSFSAATRVNIMEDLLCNKSHKRPTSGEEIFNVIDIYKEYEIGWKSSTDVCSYGAKQCYERS
jgi:hypothetical protein